MGGSCRHLQEIGEVERPLGEPFPGYPAGRRVDLVAMVIHPEEPGGDQVGPGPGEGVEDQGPGCCQPGEEVQRLVDRLLPRVERLGTGTGEHIDEDPIRRGDRRLLVDHHRLPAAHGRAGPDDRLRSRVELGTEPEVSEPAPVHDTEDRGQVELRAVGDQVPARDQEPAGMAGEDLVGIGVEVLDVGGDR